MYICFWGVFCIIYRSILALVGITAVADEIKQCNQDLSDYHEVIASQ